MFVALVLRQACLSFTSLLITSSRCMIVFWILLCVVWPTLQLLASTLDHCCATGNVSEAALYSFVASYLDNSKKRKKNGRLTAAQKICWTKFMSYQQNPIKRLNKLCYLISQYFPIPLPSDPISSNLSEWSHPNWVFLKVCVECRLWYRRS